MGPPLRIQRGEVRQGALSGSQAIDCAVRGVVLTALGK
jgi:hypothetical protein